MFESETRVVMTKGYKGIEGTLIEPLDSPFEFYVLKLDNGIHIVAGPSSFEAVNKSSV